MVSLIYPAASPLSSIACRQRRRSPRTDSGEAEEGLDRMRGRSDAAEPSVEPHMPSLDIEQLVRRMAGAASGVLTTQWPEARGVAEPAFQKLAEAVTLIASEYDAGEI